MKGGKEGGPAGKVALDTLATNNGPDGNPVLAALLGEGAVPSAATRLDAGFEASRTGVGARVSPPASVQRVSLESCAQASTSSTVEAIGSEVGRRVLLLDPHTINQIAAGEVVERPASVVKELVENALDAGATRIEIELRDAGRTLIRVTDNGCGMRREDAMVAFERHATSKIRSVDDLQDVMSLGFRGEALPSIGSVCKLTLSTGVADGPRWVVRCDGGSIQQAEAGSGPRGTEVVVSDLFFNTPARLRFLKTDATEVSACLDHLQRYGIGRADVAIKVTHQGQVTLQTSGSGDQREAIASVWGRDVGRRLVEVDWSGGADGLRVRGFVSPPDLTKPTRSHQFLFVNGRPVRSRSLGAAIDVAYRDLTPDRRYPMLALWIDIDPASVDVNVSPTKSEVRFRHEGRAFDALRQSIKGALLENGMMPSGADLGKPYEPSLAPAGLPFGMGIAGRVPGSDWTDSIPVGMRSEETPWGSDQGIGSGASGQDLQTGTGQYATAEGWLGEGHGPASRVGSTAETPWGTAGIADSRDGGLDVVGPPSDHAKATFADSAFANAALADAASRVGSEAVAGEWGTGGTSSYRDDRYPFSYLLEDLRVLGQAHLTFIVAETKAGIAVIDQHVAHERVLYEYLCGLRGAVAVERQALLSPVPLNLERRAAVLVHERLSELASVGFELEPFGGDSFLIRTVPAALRSKDGAAILRDMVDELIAFEGTTRPIPAREQIWITTSCRMAVKAGDRLSIAEMEKLLVDLATTENPYLCPHGRPIAVVLTLADLMRKFKRA